MIERQVNHLVRLVDDLLEISRITRGSIELRKESVEIGPVLTAALEVSTPLIDSLGHKLIVDIPEVPFVLNADPVRLTQIVSNLLNNAAKYTARGGIVRLTVSTTPSHVRISVRDNGAGIPDAMQASVFEPFVQLDQSISRSHGGLGIGLTLVRTLTEHHGGTVECRSDGAGTGCEFIVSLPLTDTAT
jgi:signal transduction histidine kinase